MKIATITTDVKRKYTNADAETRIVTGHVPLFDDSDGTRIMPGALQIANPVWVLAGHDASLKGVIGRGELSENKNGIDINFKPVERYSNLPDGMSYGIAYQVQESHMEGDIRVVTKAKLMSVSPNPSNPKNSLP